MAEKFLEPQNPLKKIDETTGDISYIYPLTTDRQVMMENGERLNTILTEHILYMGDAESDVNVVPVDADTLGGKPPEYYLANGSGGGGDVTVNLDSAEQSGQPSTVNADLLGGISASGYVKKSELDTSNMELLWTNISPTSDFENQSLNIGTLAKYSSIRIVFKRAKEDSKYISYDALLNDLTFTVADYYGSQQYRDIKLNKTGNIEFLTNSAIDKLIPIYIYGIKDTSVVSGDSSLDEQSFLNKVYPIGSIYMSMNEVSPATLFGVGTWSKIEDRFLLAASSTYGVGATGGEATHTLTVNEMPSHNHAVPYEKSDGNSTHYYAATGVNFSYGTITTDTSYNTQNFGGSQSHNNMPPYLAVYMWQRIS